MIPNKKSSAVSYVNYGRDFYFLIFSGKSSVSRGLPNTKKADEESLILRRMILSFLIDNKLGSFAVFFGGANEQEIHICGDTETTIASKFTFHPISEI